MVVIGAWVAGTFSLLTGVVTTAALLLVVRIGNGIGRLANDPIHTSLLTDWYQALSVWVGVNTLVFAFLSLLHLLPSRRRRHLERQQNPAYR